MRGIFLAGILAVLMAAACTGGAGGESSATSSEADSSATTQAASSSTSVGPAASSDPSSTTTSTTVPVDATPSLLVATSDGAYLVKPGVESERLIPGRVALAVEDGRGGVLYQIDSGRNWFGERDPWSTTVWWLRRGSTSPVDLLVPSAGHDLTLVAAGEVDGHLNVFYVRHEGASTSGEDPGLAIDRLRRYDTETSEIVDVYLGPAWEAGFGGIHLSGGVISMTVYGQVDSECAFLDVNGDPVEVPGDPSHGEARVDDDEGGPYGCVYDAEGRLLAYVEWLEDTTAAPQLVVVDASAGSELQRLDPPAFEGGISVRDLDLRRGWLLAQSRPDLEPRSATLVLVDDLQRAWRSPVAGWATFVSSLD